MNFSNLNFTSPAAMNITNLLSSGSSPEDVQNLVNVLLQAAAIVIIIALASAGVFVVVFVVTFPFQAVLLKYRVNYIPSPPVEAEGATGESQAQPASVPKTYPRLFHRILQIENWAGLYKGVVPSFFLQGFIFGITFLVVLIKRGNIVQRPQSLQQQLGTKLFRMVFSIPLSIIINRAITTPQKLPWFDAASSLRVLLSEAERHRPWLLYLSPGLILIDLFYEAYSIAIGRPLASALGLKGDNPPSLFAQWRLARFCALLAYAIVQTTVTCLYEVVFARLSVQYNQLTSRTVHEETEKSVPILHTEGRPYTGVVDCVKGIAMEEGYATLFRGWWIDFVMTWWKLPLMMTRILSGRA